MDNNVEKVGEAKFRGIKDYKIRKDKYFPG